MKVLFWTCRGAEHGLTFSRTFVGSHWLSLLFSSAQLENRVGRPPAPSWTVEHLTARLPPSLGFRWWRSAPAASDRRERARLAQWKHRWLLADSRGRRRRSALCLTHGSAILCLFACLHNRSDFCGQNRLVFVCFWRNIFGGQVQTTVVWAGAAAVC